MESTLKSVFISAKNYKKQLIIPHNEVSALHTFLKNTINNEVVIVNTNLGLDIYYLSSSLCGNLIKNSFFLMNSKKHLSADQFRITICDSAEDVKSFTKKSFLQLGRMPLIFTSYTKSMLHQFNENFSDNKRIIAALFVLWQHVLEELCKEQQHTQKISHFRGLLQEAFIEKNYDNVFKELIKESVAMLRCN